MQTPNLGERKLTELDFTRLTRLSATDATTQLSAILDEADIVHARAMPPDVLTMYARFVIRDLQSQRRHALEICYPRDADAAKGCLSVLSPAGMALIGLRVGALARWTGPGGQESVAQVEQVLFQPEAAGDYLS